MALDFTKNRPMTTTLDFMYELKEALKASGFTVPRSGTGTSGSYATSDLISSAAVLGTNNLAWFELLAPDGSYALLIQRVTNNQTFRIKVAPGGFTGGSPDADTVGSHASEGVILGGGTDGSPTGGTLGSTSSNGYAQICVDDAAPHGFWAYWQSSGGANQRAILFCDPVTDYDTGDTRPWVFGVMNTPTNVGFYDSANAYAWIDGTFQGVGLITGYGWAAATRVYPGGGGAFADTGRKLVVGSSWGRSPSLSSPNGPKGTSTMFRTPASAHATADLLNVNGGTKNRIVLASGGLAADWDGGTDPTV